MSLRIHIVKRPDGTGLLRCTRADGSATWQKQTGPHAAFFALHDLTHYAVETALGLRQGFFGLIAAGWEIEDTTGKGARGRLPAEASRVETIVGLLDLERGTGILATAADLPDAGVTDDDLARARQLRGELFTRWKAVPAGGTLELEFPGTPPAAGA